MNEPTPTQDEWRRIQEVGFILMESEDSSGDPQTELENAFDMWKWDRRAFNRYLED